MASRLLIFKRERETSWCWIVILQRGVRQSRKDIQRVTTLFLERGMLNFNFKSKVLVYANNERILSAYAMLGRT